MPDVSGRDLIRGLHEGRIQQAPSKYLADTKIEISNAVEELLDVGARIRPLLADGKQVGWVRGVHLSERKLLNRWVEDEVEMILHLLQLGTTLTETEIRNISTVEMRSLARLVQSLTASDMRLYPYLAPFATTSVSEQLWYARGTDVASFRERVVNLPDGKSMKIVAASDQARLWAALCNYRIQARNRLEASFNAVLVIRPWVGKGADSLSAELKAISRSLQTDSLEPWKEVIRIKPEANLEDGWAHSEDDSIEGMLRELRGMVDNDRHERVVEAFRSQTLERKEQEQRAIEKRLQERRTDPDEIPAMVIFTEEEVQTQRQERQTAAVNAVRKTIPDEPQSSLESRLAKYK